MVARMNLSLNIVSNWADDVSRVRFNAAKSQVYLSSTKRSLNVPYTWFLLSKMCLDQLVVTSSSLVWTYHPTSTLVLHRVIRNNWYQKIKKPLKVQSTSALDLVERKANVLICNDSLVESKLQGLDYSRKVTCLSIFVTDTLRRECTGTFNVVYLFY